MPRWDEIDPHLARELAWTFVPADRPELAAAKVAGLSAQPPATSPEGSPGPETEDAAERYRVAARMACVPLAEATTLAWEGTGDEARLAAIKRLLARAERLGVEVIGLDAFPLEGARLVRLLVEAYPRLTRRQRERAATVASRVPLDHPEVADLLVEIARGGERALVEAIFNEEGWAPGVGDEAPLVARLADVIDEGPSHAARAAAAEIVCHYGHREPAVAALRRALRLPSFALRARAMMALAGAVPCAVTADDLVHVLRDLVTHAPPGALIDDARERDEQILAEALLLALAQVHPDSAGEALLDTIDAEHDSLWLDAGWATEALAVGFPETGAVMTDHWLKCARYADRVKALPALRRLPPELAVPRLKLAASDPALMVREAARRIWLDRFGTACPVGAESLIGASLLGGAPSDRFASRLLVIQGRVVEAKRTLSRILLAEAPDPEALLLLVQLVADDSETPEPRVGHGELGEAVLGRFGAAGVAALAAIAARFPEPESFGWMRRLSELAERGLVPRGAEGPLRELAARHVKSDDVGTVDDALRLLSHVGAPAELFDRVLALGLGDDLGSWEARKLIAGWADRASDGRLVSEMALALADRAWDRLHNAAWMALARPAAGASVLATRVLEVAEEEEAAVEAASVCAKALREAGALDDAWAEGILGRPESPLFTVAARVWRGAPGVRAALDRALRSTARGGVSAAEAAIALVNAEPPLSPRDRRLQAVLAGSPPPERAELVVTMCVRGAPFSAVAGHLEPLFTSSDARVTGSLVGITGWLKSRKARELLRRVLPNVVDAELRADIEHQLGQSPEPFWAEG